jgi:hypothetical protein
VLELLLLLLEVDLGVRVRAFFLGVQPVGAAALHRLTCIDEVKSATRCDLIGFPYLSLCSLLYPLYSLPSSLRYLPSALRCLRTVDNVMVTQRMLHLLLD